ncbi:unnamed protein product [Closterium sp. Yama58-4]|nr:unnamed protein product [Closterium sp. Yama58-4]
MNHDAVMTDEQLAAGTDNLTDLGDYVLEDLPDGTLPDLPGERAAKKQCGEGTSSAASGGSAPTAAAPAPLPVQRSNSSGSSAATAPSSSRPAAPPRQRPAPPSRPQPPAQDAAAEQTPAGPSPNLSLTARYRNLRRHRPSVGTELRSLIRDTQSLVTILFPECSEEVRESILARISAALPGSTAFNGAVPQYEAAAGEPLRLPRKSYFRHIFSWPSANDARVFRRLFTSPFLVRLNNSRPVEVKVYTDPFPEFSAAKARGDTHLVVRNVPLGVSAERLRATLLAAVTEANLPWLADLLHFHRLKDPYDGSSYSQMMGLPVAAEGDPAFERISAVLWIPDQEDPALVNISCHACTLPKRLRIVGSFYCLLVLSFLFSARLSGLCLSYWSCLLRPFQGPSSVSSVSALEPALSTPMISGKLLGQHAAAMAFKKDLGLLLIGLDLDVEVWTCSMCDIECGLALDSAMFHLNSERHRARLLETAHKTAVKDTYAIYAPSTPAVRRPWWRAILLPALEAPTSSAGTVLAGDFNAVCSPEDRNRPPLSHETSEGLILSGILQQQSMLDSFRIPFPTTPMFSFFAYPHAAQRDEAPTASRLDRIHRPHLAHIVAEACRNLPPSLTGESWDRWKLTLCNKFKAFGKIERIRTRKTTAHLNSLVCHLSVYLATNPSDADAIENLRRATQQFERYEASRAADIALKAKLKVEGPREMGVSSLLVGINSRIKASLIKSLRTPSGSLTSDLPVMSSLCTSYYQELYSGSQTVTPSAAFWSHVPPAHLPPQLTDRLSRPFSMEEASKAIAKLPRGKTPGPDGLPGELFRQFRKTFTPVLHALLLENHSALPPSMLQGRTVLIPKKGDASVNDNLRPITLMNSDYKILAICLANRLQPLLLSLINHSQAAFIKTRKIGDTLNDTLDLFDWATTQNLPLLALTVDIRKAYNLVDRDFMLACLTHLGLPPAFVRWVALMHSNTSTRISVNNLCGPPIAVQTGVQQGCPLAPFLFLCVIEVFHRYASCFLPGFPVSRTQHRLMACYADDVTIFLTSDSELRIASQVLMFFAAVSGEHPNWAKCSLIPSNLPHSDIRHAGDIPIRGSSDFERILGIYVSSSGRTDKTWELALSQIKCSANFLAHLHATVTCRKRLSNERLNSVLSFPGRFQPPPTPSLQAIDVVAGNLLYASKFRSEGRSSRHLTHNTIYNHVEDGGVGAIKPSDQIRALNAQRAFRRFSQLPNAAIARTCVPIPFGLHGFLLDKVFVEVRIGHIVRRNEGGARRLTDAEIMEQYPPKEFPCSRRIINEVYHAMPDDWWAALSSSHSLVPLESGNWIIMAADMTAPPLHAYEVDQRLEGDSFSAHIHEVDPTGRISKAATGRRILDTKTTVPVHVVDRWLGGTFCSGAGLAARLEILQDGVPSLAALRDLSYSPQQLQHPQRWLNILPTSGPHLIPDYTHVFLSEQPSAHRDILFRLYARALPTGSRYMYLADNGICSGCNQGIVESLPHLFFECGVARPITEALQRTAREHLGITTSPSLTLFPLPTGAGQTAPWSLLVGAAARAIWNARCSHRYRQTPFKTIEALHNVLNLFLLAFKILLWRASNGSKKKRQRAANRIKLATAHRLFIFPEPNCPAIHPDLKATWLLNDSFRPP